MSISYSAPAKVILSGEHVVVYGKPAIVSAIDLRLVFAVGEGENKRKDKNVARIVDVVRKYLIENSHLSNFNSQIDYTIKSDIPIARGLGSSAAFSAAGTAAFLDFYTGKSHPIELINNLAYKVEKAFHKNPSGVDSTTSTFGGLVYFRKEFEFLKGIYKLAFKIPKKIEEKLYLIDSGKPIETTGEMVDLVGKYYNKHPKSAEEIFNKIERITKRLVISLVKEDVQLFAQQIKNNENLLEKIGIVSVSTKNLLQELSKYGFGKITGAGGKKTGSGYLLFLADDVDGLKKYCKYKKINIIKFKQSWKGVQKT